MENIDVLHYYHNLGYKIIPIYYQTKVPVFKSWNGSYDFCKIQKFVKCSSVQLNFGILLGEIIDIEGDCEKSNNEIDDLLAQTPHPVYQSKKSKHHLFRNNIKSLTRIVKDGIEYRAHRHQSVIPPSCHENGTQYEWLTDVYKFHEIPYLPKKISNFLTGTINQNKPIKRKKDLKPMHTSVTCAQCSEKVFIHQVRFQKELHALKSMGHRWSCRTCRPTDLREMIRSNCDQKIHK